jgi:hypothetical protein
VRYGKHSRDAYLVLLSRVLIQSVFVGKLITPSKSGRVTLTSLCMASHAY